MMVRTRGIFLGAVSLALLSGTAGCVHREILAFHDHGSKPLTAVVVDKRTNYLYMRTEELVWYSCAEQGDKLTCKRLCGGGGDLVCPQAMEVYTMMGGMGGSNVQ